MLICPTVF